MYAESDFNRELCSGELEVIGSFLDLEKVESYNNECGAEAYYDCYWEWGGWHDNQYYCIKDSFDNNKIDTLNSAIIGVIKKQPFVFLKSRWTAFRIIAQQTTSYNLFMPLILVIAIGICGCFRRDVMMVLLALGILGHTGITILTMPASYFKYFYELFTCSYILAAITIFNIIHDYWREQNNYVQA